MTQRVLCGLFAAWLFTIARNTQRDQARRPEVHQTDSIHLLDPPTTELDPQGRLELQHLEQRVQQVLDNLPERQREVFLLRYYSEMSFREIAELLERPLGTVLSHMHRAITAIRKEIDSHAR